MKKKLSLLTAFCALAVMATGLVACSSKEEPKPVPDGSYDFVIYDKDGDNSVLSDNPVIARYHIEYTNCTTVTDTLIKKGSAYFFTNESPDYLIMKNTQYGLSYSEGYFKDFSGCASGDQIDVSWSYTAVNGEMAPLGIGATPLEGLTEYGFVINGWAA